MNIRCVFWLFLQLLCETFLILRRTEHDTVINAIVFVYSTHYNGHILIENQFSRQIFFFEIYSNTKFDENPSCGSRAAPYGRKDVTKVTVAFRNLTNVTKNQSSWTVRRGVTFNFETRCISNWNTNSLQQFNIAVPTLTKLQPPQQETSLLMMFIEAILIYCASHTSHIIRYTAGEQNSVSVKPGGTYLYYCVI